MVEAGFEFLWRIEIGQGVRRVCCGRGAPTRNKERDEQYQAAQNQQQATIGHYAPWQATTRRFLAGTRTLFLLHWRTFVVAIGAKHTAILAKRPQQDATIGTAIEELTGVCWHLFHFCKLALWTGDG